MTVRATIHHSRHFVEEAAQRGGWISITEVLRHWPDSRPERVAESSLALRARHLQTNRTKAAGSFYPARVVIHLNLKPEIIPIVVNHLHPFRCVVGGSQGCRRPGREDRYDLPRVRLLYDIERLPPSHQVAWRNSEILFGRTIIMIAVHFDFARGPGRP